MWNFTWAMLNKRHTFTALALVLTWLHIVGWKQVAVI